MAALYANENFPLQVVRALRDCGHDVLTTGDVGEAGRAVPDSQVLAYATRQGRAVVTLNRRDFIRLHQQDPGHGGIIVCTLDVDATAQARRIHQEIEGVGDLKGQLLRVNRPSS